MFGSARLVWGRTIYRRAVRHDFGRRLIDYSDTPDCFPSGASDPARWVGQT
jgi:hypothetical protein